MQVNKTVKLFIGGAFPRTESGRSYEQKLHGSNEIYANICQSSRKDFRNAVDAAGKGFEVWSKRAAFNHSQILYRIAEMMEGKRDQFCLLFEKTLGMDRKQADIVLDTGRDAFVYYAGFCDKYQQIMGSVNSVSGPYHNFSTPSPMGVVTFVEDDKFDFENLCATIAAILVGGNSIVALLGSSCPGVLAPLAETFATSDVPGGVINLLTGSASELSSHIGGHREVRSVNFQYDDKDLLKAIKFDGADNMKRVVSKKRAALCLDRITDHIEVKTVWHPIGV